MFQERLSRIATIKELSNELDELYKTELTFRNHCYLRIAFDNTIGDKWDLSIKRPFVKHADDRQIANALDLLNLYRNDKNSLLVHNQKSLFFRKKQKQNQKTKTPQLF